MEKMKRLFVVAPMKYGMNNEQINAYRLRLERMAYEAEQKIGDYCEIKDCIFWLLDNPHSLNNNAENMKSLIASWTDTLCHADYAVFSDDWRTSKECSLLHDIAEALNISILEVFG